jgi:uncharacterized OsmC-like protein
METTTKISKMKNGVDLQRLQETIQAVTENPELGKFQFRAVNEWIDCGHNRSNIQGFYGPGQEDTSRQTPFIVENDEPDVLLGTDNAPNPVEFILHALAGCLTTTLVYHAAARGIEVESVSSSYEGDLDLRGFLGIDPNVPRGYQNVRVIFDIRGNLSKEQKQDLIELAHTFSPVYDIITRAVQVEVTLS